MRSQYCGYLQLSAASSDDGDTAYIVRGIDYDQRRRLEETCDAGALILPSLS